MGGMLSNESFQLLRFQSKLINVKQKRKYVHCLTLKKNFKGSNLFLEAEKALGHIDLSFQDF